MAGFDARKHLDHFKHNERDEIWLSEVGRRGWVALTHNRRQAAIEAEREAAMRSGLGLFFLIGKVPHKDLADNLVRTMPRVLRFLKKNPRPFIAKIYIGARRPGSPKPDKGSIEMYLSADAWRGR